MPFEIDKNIASAKTLLAVELDSANLIISYGKMSKDKFDLENIAIFDITQNNSDEIALKIKQTIAVFKIKNTQVVNIIPNQYVITKNIEIPSIDPNEIKEIIDLQAGRHTPYSRNEIVMDYSEIGVIHGRYTKVLLAIVKREIVEEREKIIKSAGLKLAGVLLGAECLAQLIFEKYKEPDSDIPVFFVHIGGQNIDFIAAKNGILIYLRTAQIPLDIVLSNNPEQSQQFVAEVKKTIDLYCSEELSKQPEKIYFSGLINKDIIDNETLKAGLEGFRLRYIDRSDLF
ncbi:MAG: pilus assembly protein PilM, partial [Candidatus Omnitrophica bacterium]|nr:pilus assembly protein PilM [Candidatus Omnitrophota bacterium]